MDGRSLDFGLLLFLRGNIYFRARAKRCGLSQRKHLTCCVEVRVYVRIVEVEAYLDAKSDDTMMCFLKVFSKLFHSFLIVFSKLFHSFFIVFS